MDIYSGAILVSLIIYIAVGNYAGAGLGHGVRGQPVAVQPSEEVMIYAALNLLPELIGG